MIYFLIAFFILIGIAKYDREGEASKGTLYYMFICISMILVFGLRYRVGGDTFNYMLRYSAIPSIDKIKYDDLWIYQIEPGFFLLNSFSKYFTDTFYLVQIIQSAFVNIVIFYYIKIKTRKKFLAVLFYFLFASFYFNTEIMRESIAVCFFLLGTLQLEKGKRGLYYLFWLCAFCFHYSSVFLLLFPLLQKVMSKNFIWLLTGTLIVCLALNFIDLDSLSFLNGYMRAKIENNMGYSFTIWGKISALLKFVVLPYYIYYLYTKYYKTSDTNVYYLKAMILYGCLTLSQFSIMMRVMNYFTIILILIFVNIYPLFKAHHSRVLTLKSLNRPILLFLLFFFYMLPYLRSTSNLVSGTYYYTLWYPYFSIFDEQEYPPREALVIQIFDELRNR